MEKVMPRLREHFNYGNVMEVPRLTKIVVNIGCGDAVTNSKVLETSINELGRITGQRPQTNLARRAISNFKLRAGMAVGCSVTLRGEMMYEFLDRLVNVAIPRVRDFRGIPTKSFDGRGNYNLGIQEQIIFPEIEYDSVESISGLDIAFVTSARTDEEALELLREMGMPFRRD
jgi:large subunit ribosomal protein L5